MIINRIWNMPNSKTFSIKPIEELIHKYAYGTIIDPFANSNKLATITNDLDTQYNTVSTDSSSNIFKKSKASI